MIMRAFAVAAGVFVGAGSAVFALDHSTKDAAPRSPIELCCVDTAVRPPLETSGAAASQALVDPTRITPVTDAKPGLDGADWSCRRPDGSRRCFSSLRNQ
jgi:hypothetical protein